MKIKQEKITLGFIVLMILGFNILVIQQADVKLRFDRDKTTFYVLENDNWVIGGREYLRAYDGSSRINRDLKKVSVEYDFDNQTKITKIIKKTPYKRGPLIIETYIFDGNINDIELVPISHTIEVIKGKGYQLLYEVTNLVYDGPTLVNVQSPQSFGRKMNVEWESDKSFQNVLSSEGKLSIWFAPDLDYVVYSVRLFDPPSVKLFLNDLESNQSYELGSVIQIHYNSTVNETICIDIDQPDGTNVSCAFGLDQGYYNYSASTIYVNEFNDSTSSKTFTSSGSVFGIDSRNIDDLQSLQLNITGNLNLPENVSLDFGNDGVIDYLLTGFLAQDYLYLNKFTNGNTEEILTFPGASNTILRYIHLPGDETYTYNISFDLSGTQYLGDFLLNFTDEIYLDTTESDWNVTLGRLSRIPEVPKHLWSWSDNGRASASNFPFEVIDDDVETYGHAYTGTIYPLNPGTGTGYFGLGNVSATDNITITYNLNCDTQGSSGFQGNATLWIYKNSTDTWQTIASKYCEGTQAKGTGITTFTVTPALMSTYRNDTGFLNYKVYVHAQQSGAAGFAYANAYLYDLTQTELVYHNTWAAAAQNTTTLTLFESSETFTNVTMFVNSSNSGTDDIDVYISADNGVNYEPLSILDKWVQHNFTSQGDTLKMIISLRNTDTSITPYVNFVNLSDLTGNYPTNISIDLGDDGIWEYSDTEIINETLSIHSVANSTAVTNYYSDECPSRIYDDSCIFPIRFLSVTSGILNISDINFTTTKGLGPTDIIRTMNITAFDDECTTNPCTVPINITWVHTAGDNVTINDIRLGYYGDGNYTITVRNVSNSDSQSYIAFIYYADWNHTFPQYINYLEFIPKKGPTTKNVTPYGQTSDKPILNFTMRNFGGRQMNFSMLNNESFSCVNLSVSLTENKSDGFVLGNATWHSLGTNNNSGDIISIWMWADYECNFSTWTLWYPELFFRGCSINTICDGSLT